MRDTSFHAANKLSEDLQDVKTKMETIEDVQRTVLGAIDENRNVMTQVAHHICRLCGALILWGAFFRPNTPRQNASVVMGAPLP